jgi:hypothetical protein
VSTGATAAVSISGSAPSQSLSFVLPVGPKGDTGATGPAGPPINLGDETPQPLGTASAGTALAAARADHIHATLTSFPYGSLTGVPSTFAPAAHSHSVGDVSGLQAALDGKQAAGSYVTLVNGLISSSVLPSYVDDVVDVGGTLPSSGEVGKIYVVSTGTNINKIYRWSGSTFIEISPSPGSTDSVTEGSTNLYFTNARAVAAIPTASSSVAGLVKVGSGLTITSGVLAATGGSGSFSGTVDGGDYAGANGGGGGGGGGGATTDPLFSSVRLLINADGAAYAYDQSANNWTVSSFGNAAATATNPKFGAKSLAFDGAGDYLRVVTGSSAFPFGTGDFTVEAWIWFPSRPGAGSNNQYFSLFDTRSGSTSAYGYAVFLNASGQLGANWGDTQNGATLLGGSLDSATWHHVALVRSAGTMRLYANGFCVANGSTNVSVNMSHNEVWISRSFTDGGGYYESAGLMGYWNGYIDDIRFTAAARYTGVSNGSTNFTVPTAAFPSS